MKSKFSMAPGGATLIRHIIPRRGQPYQHICEKSTFEEVCHAIDKLSNDHVPFVGEDVVADTGLPSSQVFTALAFLKERCSIVPSGYGRTHETASDDVYLDGMVEWHALEHGYDDYVEDDDEFDMALAEFDREQTS